MKEYKAKDGYYYRKGNIYAKALCLPDSVHIEDFELVTEEAYRAYLAEEEARILQEKYKRII